ncbi:MAG TPA: GAF domain-containing protein [Anaerolineae bacterium]|nr:GAF domain-containing protein [Anaerolineae bacterium]
MIDTGIPDEPLAYILIPIITRDKVLGVISVQSYTPNAFNEMHVAMLSAIASQSAVALDNTRLFAQERRRSSELTLLERIGYELARITDLSTALKEIITETRDLLEADSVSIYTYDERQGQFRPQAFTIAAGDVQPSQRSKPPRLRGLTSRIVGRRRAIITRALPGNEIGFEEIDLEQGVDPEQLRRFEFTDPETVALIRERDIHLSIGFPLIAGVDVMGALYISYTRPHEFRWDDLRTIARLAQHAATAIQRANVYDEIHALHQAGQALTGQADMKPVIEKLFEYGHTILGADIIVLFSYHAAAHKLETPPLYSGQVYQPDMLTNYGDVDPDDVVWQIVKSSEGFFTRNAQTDVHSAGPDMDRRPTRFVGREKIESSAAVPLRAEGEVVGALFFNYRVPQRFGSHQRLLINTFAAYAATAIQRARLMGRRVDELRALAAIDKVITGGSLQEVLDTIIRSACQIVGVDDGSIFLAGEDGEYLYRAATYGEAWQTGSPEQFKIGALGVQGWVAQHKRPARIGDVDAELPWKDLYVEVLPGVQSELAVPILDEHGALIGVINLESRAANAFLADDERLLAALAEQAYIAIRNQRLFEAERQARLDLERRAKQLVTAAEVARDVADLRTLDDLLNQVVHAITERFGFYHVGIFLLGELAEYAVLRAANGEDGQRMLARGHRFKVGGAGVVGYAIATGQPHITMDVVDDPLFFANPDLPLTRSEMAVPLKVKDQVIGALDVQSTTENAFTEGDVILLSTLADQVSIAIVNARLFEVERRLRKELELLNDINRAISSTLNLKEVLNFIVEQSVTLIQAPVFHVMLYDELRGDLYLAAGRGMSGELGDFRLSVDEGIPGRAARIRQAIRVSDVTRPPWNAIYAQLETDTRSELAVPLLQDGKLIGVLNLESPEVGAFVEHDQRLLERLAAQAAIAVLNARNYEEIQQSQAQINELISTLQKQYSELQEAYKELKFADQQKLEFLAIASHELRKPLTPLHLILERATLGELSSRELLDELKTAFERTEHLTRLVNRLLDVARIEAGKVKPEFLHYNVLDLVQGSIRDIQHAVDGKGIRLTTRMFATPISAELDPNMIKQVLDNLLENAVKHTGEAGSISVVCACEDSEIRIAVSDAGKGIPEDQLKRIFDKFHQVEPSLTRSVEGLGLGLYIVRAYVEMHGGAVTVDSEEGKGSTFSVMLPVRQSS